MAALRILVALFAAMTILAAADHIEIFGYKWNVPHAADWSIAQDGGTPLLRLQTGREPLPGPRRPFQFALAETAPFAKLTLEADAKPLQRSLMVVFAYQDPAHFDYLHFSIDTATKQPFHNGVFHVYGGERVRISAPDGPAAFAETNRWFHIKAVWGGSSGSVQGFVDGKCLRFMPWI
jgi:hypothetical protein